MSMGRDSGKTPERVVQLISEEVARIGQNATARATGLTLWSVQRYVRGIGEPTHATLQKLANYFKVTFVIEIKPEVDHARR